MKFYAQSLKEKPPLEGRWHAERDGEVDAGTAVVARATCFAGAKPGRPGGRPLRNGMHCSVGVGVPDDPRAGTPVQPRRGGPVWPPACRHSRPYGHCQRMRIATSPLRAPRNDNDWKLVRRWKLFLVQTPKRCHCEGEARGNPRPRPGTPLVAYATCFAGAKPGRPGGRPLQDNFAALFKLHKGS